MADTFSIGSKCAVMLPRKFINPQLTPAQGLIINKLLDSSSLVLIEEVWEFKGLRNSPTSEMVYTFGRIKDHKWGWREVPEIIEKDEYLVVPAQPQNLMYPSERVLDSMIKQSLQDFHKLFNLRGL